MTFEDHREVDEAMAKLVKGLIEKLGRIPTEDEVMVFIFGNEKERQAIWKKR